MTVFWKSAPVSERSTHFAFGERQSGKRSNCLCTRSLVLLFCFMATFMSNADFCLQGCPFLAFSFDLEGYPQYLFKII